jgi:phosphonate transport system substrate-binding protein
MKNILTILFILLSLNLYADPLRFGIASIISPEESLALYHDFNDYIGDKLGRDVETVIKRDYDVMNQMLKSSSVDIASICTGAVAYLDDSDIRIIAVPEVQGKHSYQSYIITNTESGIKDVNGLKGSTFAFTDRLSNSGTIYPTFLIIKIFSKTPEEIFKNVYYTKSHDKSIYLVNKGVVDAAAVDSLIYDYIKKTRPAEVSNTEIIHKSPEIIAPPIVASGTLDETIFVKIQDILLNMHKTNEGSEILKHLNIDKFVKADMADFKTIREIRQAVETFNSESNTK